MICYHKKKAWLVRYNDGSQKMIFDTVRPSGSAIPVFVDCGKCAACRANKANEWALRVSHEMQYCDGVGCFLTLTYDNQHLPIKSGVPTLIKKDLQDFVKRLRRYLDYRGLPPIRAYFAAGEYGKRTLRPHYHILILGWCPSDLQYLHQTPAGSDIYISGTVGKLWTAGIHSVGKLEFRSAAYCARYTKKMVGVDDPRRADPFNLSSRNIPLSTGKQGALGAQWVIDHLSTSFNLPYLTCEDWKVPVPDYYLDLLKRYDVHKYNDLVLAKLQYLQSGNGDTVRAYGDGSSEPRPYNTLTGEHVKGAEIKRMMDNLDDLQRGKLSLLQRR